MLAVAWLALALLAGSFLVLAFLAAGFGMGEISFGGALVWQRHGVVASTGFRFSGLVGMGEAVYGEVLVRQRRRRLVGGAGFRSAGDGFVGWREGYTAVEEGGKQSW